MAEEQQQHLVSLAGLSFDPIFLAYASLIGLALVPIYVGSKQGLHDEQTGDSSTKGERLSRSDAYWFPVIGSGVLFGFYLLFRYLSKEYINYLLTAYFAIFGGASLTKLYVSLGTALVPTRWYDFDHVRLFAERKKGSEVYFDLKITWLHVLMGVGSVGTTAYYALTKNWITNNLFAEAFATSAVSMIQLDTFGTGMILLAGLFVYDIFWVFGTDVMVSVAKNFDAPVKVLFPRDVVTAPFAKFTMLGLGDIVIPGVFIALCLKFDHHMAKLKGGKAATDLTRCALSLERNPYFTVSFLFYIAGLVTTMTVMHTFKAAQPALLYLSPAGILSVLLTALVRGELKEVFAFTTEPPAKDQDDDHEVIDSGEESDEEEEDDEEAVFSSDSSSSGTEKKQRVRARSTAKVVSS